MAKRSTARVRKNMDINAGKLAAAKRVLGARTETEAVDKALDYVLFQREVFEALDRLAALGGISEPNAAVSPTVRRVAEP